MKSWIILGVVVVIAVIVYFYYSGGQAPADSSGLTTDNGAAVGAEVFGLLSEINSLSIDTSIFSGQTYQTLVDHTVPIPVLNVGRPNPFAPLPGDLLVNTTTATPAGR